MGLFISTKRHKKSELCYNEISEKSKEVERCIEYWII